MGLLTRREHSRLELFRKLKAKRFPQDEIETLLDRLEQEGLQSDARFAESYVYSRAQRGFGPLRITFELKGRGVSGRLIETYVDYEDQAWFEIACREYRKKFNSHMPVLTRKEQARRTRFLQARGFTSDIIHSTLAQTPETESSSGPEGREAG